MVSELGAFNHDHRVSSPSIRHNRVGFGPRVIAQYNVPISQVCQSYAHHSMSPEIMDTIDVVVIQECLGIDRKLHPRNERRSRDTKTRPNQDSILTSLGREVLVPELKPSQWEDE
jgi:hypothetical protein